VAQGREKAGRDFSLPLLGSGRSRRDEILDAAADLVRERGAVHLTLDAVSAKAKVSKGGLLYHFQTKEALLQAMVARLEATLTRAREGELAKLGETPARTLKAHILSMEALRRKQIKPIAAALLAAGSNDPRLLKDAKEFYEAIIGELEAAGISSAFTRVVICAVKGLLLSELLGTATYTGKQRRAVIDELLLR
jgi:AcrR family transcriptional regulator